VEVEKQKKQSVEMRVDTTVLNFFVAFLFIYLFFGDVNSVHTSSHRSGCAPAF